MWYSPAICRWSDRVRMRCRRRQRTGSITRRWTAILPATASSPASPAGRKFTAGGARPTARKKSSNGSRTTSTTLKTGRCCSTFPSWRAPRSRSSVRRTLTDVSRFDREAARVAPPRLPRSSHRQIRCDAYRKRGKQDQPGKTDAAENRRGAEILNPANFHVLFARDVIAKLLDCRIEEFHRQQYEKRPDHRDIPEPGRRDGEA